MAARGGGRVGDVEGDGADAVAVLGDEVVELPGPAGGRGDEVAGLERGATRARPKPREEPVTNQSCFMPLSTTLFP